MKKKGNEKTAAAKKGELMIFPKMKDTMILQKSQILAILESEPFSLKGTLLVLLRIPERMVRGLNHEQEYYDVLSIQPVPTRAEESPSYCHDKGLPAPGWIIKKYVSITDEKGDLVLTLVDKEKGVFVKGSLKDQESLEREIYKQIP